LSKQERAHLVESVEMMFCRADDLTPLNSVNDESDVVFAYRTCDLEKLWFCHLQWRWKENGWCDDFFFFFTKVWLYTFW